VTSVFFAHSILSTNLCIDLILISFSASFPFDLQQHDSNFRK